MEDLYFASCNIAASILLMCSFILLIRRKEGNVSRVAMAATFFIIGLLFLTRTVLLYYKIGPFGSSSIFTLLQALFIVTTFAIFPARVVFPRLLRRHKLVILYIPIIIYFLIYLISFRLGVEYLPFNPYRVIVDGEFFRFDIIFRFIIYLTPQILTIVMLVIVFRYSSLKIARSCVICLQFFSVLATLMFFFEQYFYLSVTIYHAYSALLVIYLTYVELFDDSVVVSRSSILNLIEMSRNSDNIINAELASVSKLQNQPEPCQYQEPAVGYVVDSKSESGSDSKSELEPELELNVEIDPEQESSVDDLNPELWSRLEKYMKTEEPWRSHDLHLNNLAQMMMTNRTTLSQTIHAHGYDRFYDYIAKYRIEAFCRVVDSGDYDSIKSIFISVGFGSKSGAFKQFRLIHNMTPGEYIAKVKASK